VMVKRAWPKGWTNRRTGLLLVVLAFTLMSSISDIDQKLMPVVELAEQELTGGNIFSVLSSGLRDQLIAVDPALDGSIRDKSIGGGYAGAIQYTLLFSLFGANGAKLILIV